MPFYDPTYGGLLGQQSPWQVAGPLGLPGQYGQPLPGQVGPPPPTVQRQLPGGGILNDQITLPQAPPVASNIPAQQRPAPPPPIPPSPTGSEILNPGNVMGQQGSSSGSAGGGQSGDMMQMIGGLLGGGGGGGTPWGLYEQMAKAAMAGIITGISYI